MSVIGRWPVPDSWCWAAANKFSAVVGGGTPKNAKDESNYAENGIPWLTPADLSGYAGTHISRGGRDLSDKGFASCSAQMLPRGSVLLSSRAPVGYCVVASNEICTNQGFKSFSLSADDLSSEYLRYYLTGSKRYLEGEASGTTFLELSGSRAAQLQFPLAPANEQRRIVSKIDELFSRIDEGEAALARVETLVERYRQSVLKAAVTGELTRDWRAAKKRAGEPVDSGAALLARILKARRAAWEADELKKMKAKGKPPTDDRWKQKYQEPAPPDTTDLPELPEGWVWALLDQLCGLVTSGSRGWKEYYADQGSLFIRAQNIKHDKLELDDVAYVDLTGVSEGIRTKVSKGDLLVTITGANVTKSAMVETHLDDAYVSQHVALLRTVTPSTANFLFRWIVSPANGRSQLLESAYGAGKPGLSLEDLKSVTVALPPESEQAEIGSRVKEEVSKIDAVAYRLTDGFTHSAALRQSILKAAFSGQLVPLDPHDEPASKLLERIAAERAAAPALRNRKKKSA